MTAKEESRKPKQEQGEGRHRPRFLGHMLMKVKPLSANRILANHSWRCLESAVYTIGTPGRWQHEDESLWPGRLRQRTSALAFSWVRSLRGQRPKHRDR